jgi:hypothetical protein
MDLSMRGGFGGRPDTGFRSPRRELPQIVEVKRRLAGDSAGRAWINGREVGGPSRRYQHLARSYD